MGWDRRVRWQNFQWLSMTKCSYQTAWRSIIVWMRCYAGCELSTRTKQLPVAVGARCVQNADHAERRILIDNMHLDLAGSWKWHGSRLMDIV